MAVAQKREVRYTKKPVARKVKMGGRTVVSEALVKPGATNLTPKLHVKRGDMVMLVSGPKRSDPKRPPEAQKKLEQRNAFRGATGKVLNVFPSEGKIVIEGVNLVTRATKQRTPLGKSGLVRREAPIFASRVMLFCTSCKKPTRVKHKFVEGTGAVRKKTRICAHCGEGFDT